MCWYVMAQMLSGIGCMGSDICACLASYLLLVGERSAATLSTGASEIASRSVSSLSSRTCRVGHAHGHVNPFTRAGWTDRRPRGPGACAFLHLAEQGPFALLTAARAAKRRPDVGVLPHDGHQLGGHFSRRPRQKHSSITPDPPSRDAGRCSGGSPSAFGPGDVCLPEKNKKDRARTSRSSDSLIKRIRVT